MKIQQDNTGLYIENDRVICRPTNSSRFELDETVELELDKSIALLIINDYKETWAAIYKPKPVVLPQSEFFAFKHPYYYIEHPGWYILTTTLLGIVAFNLGFLIGLIW